MVSPSAEARSFTRSGTANASLLLRMGISVGDLRPSLGVFGLDGSALRSAGSSYSLAVEISYSPAVWV